MSRVSQSQLAELTGKAWRTIKKRLTDKGVSAGSDGKHDSAEALTAIFEQGREVGEVLDLNTERARLAKWQADKTEQEVELRAERMLDADEVTDWVVTMLSTVKSRLVQVPDAVAQSVDNSVAHQVAEGVRRLINEALEDLAAESARGVGASVSGPEAAAEPDGHRVGGPVSPPVERVKRRARTVAN